jgi:protein gp37
MVPAFTRFLSLEPLLGPLPSLNLAGIDWVFVGGESGPGHRPVDLGWSGKSATDALAPESHSSSNFSAPTALVWLAVVGSPAQA